MKGRFHRNDRVGSALKDTCLSPKRQIQTDKNHKGGGGNTDGRSPTDTPPRNNNPPDCMKALFIKIEYINQLST